MEIKRVEMIDGKVALTFGNGKRKEVIVRPSDSNNGGLYVESGITGRYFPPSSNVGELIKEISQRLKEADKPSVKEVKRMAKPGEWIKVVDDRPESKGAYKNGDILKVKTVYKSYPTYLLTECNNMLEKHEYVVLEGYKPEENKEVKEVAPTKRWTRGEIRGLLEKWTARLVRIEVLKMRLSNIEKKTIPATYMLKNSLSSQLSDDLDIQEKAYGEYLVLGTKKELEIQEQELEKLRLQIIEALTSEGKEEF